jgi:hypothetical protein
MKSVIQAVPLGCQRGAGFRAGGLAFQQVQPTNKSAAGREYTKIVRFFALILLLPTAQAADNHLDQIRATLLPMRNASGGQPARGATPAFTKIKHDLRDWVESRLPVLQWNGERWIPDPAVLQEQLNDELDRAGLFCDLPPERPCQDQSALGYLRRITIDIESGILILKTGIGVQMCGFDESAYAYESVDGAWRRLWQSEQNDYSQGKYLPQWLDVVKVSPPDYRPGSDRSEHLILTLGSEPWCTSTWHPVYYRVWRTGAAHAQPKLLLDGLEMAFPTDGVYGSATKDEVFFEYQVSGIEGGFRRPETHHYVLTADKLERSDPVALTPRQFASFWLDHPWSEISRWTEPSSRPNLQQWLEKNKGPYAEFNEHTHHCRRQPDLWQLSTHTGENRELDVFFLIRWRPPDRFTMVAISDKPSTDCTERDPEADKPRSLFQPQ